MAYSSYSPWAQTFQGAGQALSGGSKGGNTSNWFDNLITRQSNQAEPSFIGPRY